MRFATFEHNQHRHVGIVSGDGLSVQPLAVSDSVAAQGVLGLIALASDGAALAELSAHDAVAMAQVRLLAPIPRPRRNIFCVGRNYHAHAKELSGSVFKANAADPAAWPIVFTKVPECVTGPGHEVRLPAGLSEQIDYEAELAVVIGKAGTNISREHAQAHIFGYTIINDVTARDVQMRHQQWDLGKSFDTFCPMGPWVVTADELDGADTRVRCWVNGELRQDARTRDFIFDIPALIETCSRGITLYPGDIIATGTPAGVGMGMNPPSYLKTGDRVRIEIDGLGVLENPFR
ncbi:FAA hydrolase family protein [Allopusillimonas soli]|uniref:Fumarylacetoacetate hydrolase family protein n=1 Tax=Allopusillimonas soli TaxID=659016 RepID=A0A853F8K2_9BURK|nr:fumarylacetoacetate hydrolase family protein [Allopusillimonas soli]NYT35902.1 fumarylacetoacetate hydrolase family protein [Allopusillimonas soli]TEA76263.1 FAA hydrolase family protein [Allopusillimonas soli]